MAKVQKISGYRLSENNMSGINIRKQCLEQDNNMLQEHIMESKAWHEATQSIQQKSLTDHKPKGIRKYNGNHVNIASFVNRFRLSRKLKHGKTDSRRHVCELDALTTRHCMTN